MQNSKKKTKTNKTNKQAKKRNTKVQQINNN